VIELTVHYDFGSTLCYLAHRLMGEMAEDLRALGLGLRWSPVDLSQLTGWPRGAEVPEVRRRNAARVAEELSLAVRVPRRWPDSRLAGASALWVEDQAGPERASAWRERIWSAAFEEEREPWGAETLVGLARDLDLALDAAGVRACRDDLILRTQLAAAGEVTGVPTFMLDTWPFGGIQSRETMRVTFERWLERRS